MRGFGARARARRFSRTIARCAGACSTGRRGCASAICSSASTAIAAFYDARLPADVRDRASLAAWCAAGHERRALRDDGRPTSRAAISRQLPAERYPDELELAGQRARRCATGSSRARTTTASRVGGAARAARRDSGPSTLEWLVPGWLAGEGRRAAARRCRRSSAAPLVPLPDAVAELLPALGARRGRQPLDDRAVRGAARGARRDARRRRCSTSSALPPHLRMRIEPCSTRTAACSRRAATCARLQREARASARAEPGRDPPAAPRQWTRTGVTQLGLRRSAGRRARARSGRAISLCTRRSSTWRVASISRLLPPGPAAVGSTARRAPAAAEGAAATGGADSRAHARGARARARVSRHRPELGSSWTTCCCARAERGLRARCAVRTPGAFDCGARSAGERSSSQRPRPRALLRRNPAAAPASCAASSTQRRPDARAGKCARTIWRAARCADRAGISDGDAGRVAQAAAAVSARRRARWDKRGQRHERELAAQVRAAAARARALGSRRARRLAVADRRWSSTAG